MITARHGFLLFLVFLSSMAIFAQEEAIQEEGDPKYREDQFYIGVSYNLLSSVPSNTRIRGLSGGLQLGYLRDMPINAKRTVAIAVGAGVSLDRLGSNLFIGEDANEQTIFEVIGSDIQFDNNRFSVSTVEVPIEFRWRNSTPSSHKFWRIYGGVKFGYTYYYRAYFKQTNNEVSQTNIPEFDRFRMTGTLSFGRNAISLYANYTINPFFKDAVTVDGDSVDFRTVKLGIIFYIL